MPKRSQAPALSRVWRQNGANLSQNLLPHHYRNLRASKTTFILKISQIFSGASYLPASGACICLASPFPYSNIEGQKTTFYFSLFENLSTPIPHGFEAKSKHRAEIFLLLLYRNIQSKKVNTALKLFPLLLNSHMRGLEHDIELRLFRKVPLLSYRNIGGRKTTSIFESSQKIHKLVGFHGSKRTKNACLFSEADAL